MVKTWRCLVIGCPSVGKTSIVEQLLYGNVTIGQGFGTTCEDVYVVDVGADRTGPLARERLRIYDTPPLDTKTKAPKIPDCYHTSHDAFILVYSINEGSSFECLDAIRRDIDKHKEKRDMPVIMLLGNKLDLISELPSSRQVLFEEAQRWAESYKMKLFEVSIADRQSIVEAFTWLAGRLPMKRK